MTTTSRSIDGFARSVSEALNEGKFFIDYYQREHKWETKHVEELITDLASKFLQFYQEGHERKAVAQYPGYFLPRLSFPAREPRPISSMGNND